MRHMPHPKPLAFHPLPGLSSPHAQTVMAKLIPSGNPPPSIPCNIRLSDNDPLYFYESTPIGWNATQKTVVLVHGMGGDYTSCYMVRLSRKLYQAGYRVVRVNLRSAGDSLHQTRRPYHGGASSDILEVVSTLKQKTPLSPITLIGFSLGGNMALKLAGELGQKASSLLEMTIAICPPIDLANSSRLIDLPSNHIYNRYFLRNLTRQARHWTNGHSFATIYEFDSLVTAPQWGFESAADYYRQCSSRFVLPAIKHPCHLIFAADDPFVDYTHSLDQALPAHVNVWLSPKGGHLGFLGSDSWQA